MTNELVLETLVSQTTGLYKSQLQFASKEQVFIAFISTAMSGAILDDLGVEFLKNALAGLGLEQVQ